MTVHQWDVVKIRIQPGDKTEHFAVIISPEEVVRNAKMPRINVLYCTTLKPAEGTGPDDVRLNGSEGMERPTIVSCSHFYTVTRDKIFATTGCVGIERRRQIARKIVASFRLAL